MCHALLTLFIYISFWYICVTTNNDITLKGSQNAKYRNTVSVLLSSKTMLSNRELTSANHVDVAVKKRFVPFTIACTDESANSVTKDQFNEYFEPPVGWSGSILVLLSQRL